MIDIRTIEPSDTESVNELITGIMDAEFPHDHAAYAYDDLDSPAEHYAGARDVFLVAEKDGLIVGTAAVKEDDAELALLRRVFVHPDFRGKGYGARLLSRAVMFCCEHGYKRVVFHGTPRMKNALALCLKSGFERDDVAELGNVDLITLVKTL